VPDCRRGSTIRLNTERIRPLSFEKVGHLFQTARNFDVLHHAK